MYLPLHKTSILSFAVAIFIAASLSASETYHAGLPHPRTNVPYERALADALAIVENNPKWKVARCEGFSMSPFFSERSILLVKEISFEKLKPGMVALYVDASNDLVAHKLIKKTEEGWTSHAFQNDVHDPTMVSEDNFQGIAFGVLNAQNPPDETVLASIDEDVLTVLGKTYK